MSSGPYGTDDDPDPDAEGSAWKKQRRTVSRKEKKVAIYKRKVDELTELQAACQRDQTSSIASRGLVVGSALDILDRRQEITPAWNDH
eukprot:4638501-Heterocapsa_arctica.AAC.1